MTLPTFRYHPDPLASGSVVVSDKKCRCCGKARGYIYTGPVYAEGELEDMICPWCIADGSANKKFDATFFDAEAVDDEVPDAAMDEICERTPGYIAWQQGHWPACCGDAVQFIGPAGNAEVELGAHREWLHSVMAHHPRHGHFRRRRCPPATHPRSRQGSDRLSLQMRALRQTPCPRRPRLEGRPS
jgi:uncharacterized protein CbrC (UPF0167 family)